VQDAIAAGRTAVVHAYALGKAQEVTRILTAAGVRVVQHDDVFEVSQVYLQCGVDLGEFELHRGQNAEGAALVVPPRRHSSGDLARIRHPVTFAVTGWAGDGSARYRLGVDHGIPLSDHADFYDLLHAIEQVDPSVVYCTHGPASFVEHVRAAGYTAFPLDGKALLFR
jgi:putative mRNA 3-end processing factor